MNLLGAVLYDPSTAANKATTAAAVMAVLDATNITLAVTVPAHGKLLVKMRTVLDGATTMPQVLLGVMNHTGGAVLGRVSPMASVGGTALATTHVPLVAEFVITGLTPGALQLDAACGVELGVAATAIRWGGPNNTVASDAWGAFQFEIWDPQPLPTAAPATSGGLPTVGTGANQIDLDASGRVNIGKWLGTLVTAASAGIPDVNVKNINNVSAASVTTINANQGTTQPINFTGTGASALAKSDMVDIAGAAVSTTSAQIGVNVVQVGGITQTAGDIYGAVTAAIITGAPLNQTAASETLTTGTDAGGVANTADLDGTYDTWTAVGNAIDGYYQFDISGTAGGTAVSVTWDGYFTGAVNVLKVYYYNWSGAAWKQIGTIAGIAGTVVGSSDFDLPPGATGTGGNAGLVRIRFANTSLVAGVLNTDRILLGYAQVLSPPANWSSLAITAGGIVQADIQTIKTQAVTCAGGVTIPAATLASTANITAGTITTVSGNVGGNVAGSVGSVTGAVGSVTGAVGSVTAGVMLAASQHVIVDSGTVTTVSGNVNGSVGSVTGAVGSVTTAVTLPTIPANWIAAAGIAAGALNGKGDWSTYAGSDTAGTTTLLARLTATRAGNLDNLDAAISTRSTYAGGAVASVTGNVGGNVVGSVASVTAAITLPSIPANWITATGINAAALNGKGDWLATFTVDGKTRQQALQYIAATTAGKISGAGTGTEVFKGLDGATTRVTVTVDSSGNRSTVVYV